MKKMQFKSNDKKGQKKKLLTILAGLMLILMLAGTYAWKSYTDWVRNHMQSLGFDSGKVTIVENFKPKPVLPNEKMIKEVDVLNSTPVNAFVRVSFEEQLSKLADGAAKSAGYTKADEAGFPTIFDAKSYYEAKSSWIDKTEYLRINEADNKASVVDPNLRLFVNGEGKNAQAALLRVVEIKGDAFPTNFIFENTDYPIPTIVEGAANAQDYKAKQSANLTKLAGKTETVKVAQKVTGHVERITEKDIYLVKTQSGLDAGKPVTDDKALAIWGYKSNIAPGLQEADWAGEKVWVNTDAKEFDKVNFVPGAAGELKTASKIDSDLTFNFGESNIISGSGKAFEFKEEHKNKWFYNTDDGYFYYLSALPSGTQTNATVLNSIQFPDKPEYFLSAYDVHVGSEAIPAQRAMLTTAPKGKGGDVDAAKKPDYMKDGKLTEENGVGFGLSKDNNKLYDFLAGQATIEDDAQ
ncbi:hypothetical protein [Vagococcus sp.]|uniref:hypothetical protein n=1 Tax=Vagococcus sp. TaxID=1933889 RepID=UPI002FC86952